MGLNNIQHWLCIIDTSWICWMWSMRSPPCYIRFLFIIVCATFRFSTSFWHAQLCEFSSSPSYRPHHRPPTPQPRMKWSKRMSAFDVLRCYVEWRAVEYCSPENDRNEKRIKSKWSNNNNKNKNYALRTMPWGGTKELASQANKLTMALNAVTRFVVAAVFFFFSWKMLLFFNGQLTTFYSQ